MSIIVVLAVGLFLLLFVGFGVDMTNLFLHRQMSQNAADAACVAAGVDMLKQRVNGRCTTAGGSTYACGNFTALGTLGTPFDCASTPTAAPCQYAALNGYSGATGAIPLPGQPETNSVRVSFPASVPGIVTPNPGFTGPYPFVQVDVYELVKVYFASLLSGTKTQQVHALAKCGLQVRDEAVPILVLDPTEPKSFQVSGTPFLQILGGPNRSIQVNSGADAAQASGDAAYLSAQNIKTQVDLTHAGPNYQGGNFGVTGGPSTESMPSPFNTGPGFGWQSHVIPMGDPFATLPPPADLPGTPGTKTFVPYPLDGCPDSTIPPGQIVPGCFEYTAGDYVGGINVQNFTAIFDPGVYYIKGGQLRIDANSLVRPSKKATTVPGDINSGTIFYLTCPNPGNCTSGNVASVYISANSGKRTVDQFATINAHCNGDTWAPQLLPGGIFEIPKLVDGNVLLAPCTTDGTYPGAPPLPSLPNQQPQRGILMFGDRSAGAQETMSGGGGLLLAGTEYFRDCPNLLTTGKCSDPPADYQTVTKLEGGSGSGTRVYGQIITDQLTLFGTSGITMDLNPWTKPVLTVELLQ